MRPSIVAFACLALLALLPARARADVIAPPVDGACPDGSDPQASHGLSPAFCNPRLCSTDAECTGGNPCTERPFCATGPWVVDDCPLGDECTSGAPCTTLKVCAGALPPPDAGPPDGGDTSGAPDDMVVTGCSCRVAGPAQGAAWCVLGAAAATAAWVLRRRR
jgi:hypothetical protein